MAAHVHDKRARPACQRQAVCTSLGIAVFEGTCFQSWFDAQVVSWVRSAKPVLGDVARVVIEKIDWIQTQEPMLRQLLDAQLAVSEEEKMPFLP